MDHQRLNRRERELDDADLARLAEDVEQRYKRSAAAIPYSGDLNTVPQRLLMPSVNDANLWQVRVRVRHKILGEGLFGLIRFTSRAKSERLCSA